MKALGKWIACVEVKETQTPGGLFLPAESVNISKFVVASVGPQVTVEVQPEDTVLFVTKNALKHENIVMVHEDDMMLVLD